MRKPVAAVRGAEARPDPSTATADTWYVAGGSPRPWAPASTAKVPPAAATDSVRCDRAPEPAKVTSTRLAVRLTWPATLGVPVGDTPPGTTCTQDGSGGPPACAFEVIRAATASRTSGS